MSSLYIVLMLMENNMRFKCGSKEVTTNFPNEKKNKKYHTHCVEILSSISGIQILNLIILLFLKLNNQLSN